MAAEADPFEDEAEEFGRVYATVREKGGFGRHNADPLFCIPFDTRERRDAARRAFGARCLNCGEESRVAHERPSKFINRFALIHPVVGDGTPKEAERRWRRWQHKMCQWAQTRENRTTRNTGKCHGRFARLPVVLRSSLPSPNPAGEASTGTVAGGGRPTATRRNGSARAALRVAVQGQEAGCNLSVNDKIGGLGSFAFLDVMGVIALPSPLSDRSVPPLCTRPVAVGSSCATRSGRPSRVDYRNWPPVKTRIRSGIESMSVTVGEISVTPSTDQPTILTTHVQE